MSFSENDSEEDIWEKEREQDRREEEAMEREIQAQNSFDELLCVKGEIVELFQHTLYNLFGTLFEKKNIIFLEDPDFTYEGPSMIDRLESVANTAHNFIKDYAEKNYRQ